MRILILGSGAVGLGLGSCLLAAGADVALAAGEATVRALKEKGLRRSGIFGPFHAPPEAFVACSDVADLGQEGFDFILVCTKSNHVQTAAGRLAENRRLLKPNGKIIHFQNGWGNAEKFLPFFDPAAIYSGRVITGFIRPEPHHVQVTVHADAVHVGSLFGQPLEPIGPVCETIQAGGIPCIAWRDIAEDLWAKMLYNCALNPLGAVLDVPYGKLAEDAHTHDLMDTIIEEVYTVMQANGFATYWQTPDQYRQAFYGTLVPPTADHKSSTLQDLKAGKKTEIEALTGQILKLADQSGLAVPCNRTVYRLIRFIEDRNRPEPTA